MLFTTPSFLALLGLTLALYYAVPRYRIGLLTLVDLAFYGLPDPAHLPLFLGLSLLTFLCAAGGTGGGSGSRAEARRKLLLALGIAANAANLLFFKYALFFTRSLEELAGLPLPRLDGFLVRVVLPLGVSFYTFQLISYLADVWRDRVSPSRSLPEFWVFVSLFPKLAAGPIVRAADLLPQIQAARGLRFSRDAFSRGLLLLLVGLVKKLVLADTLSPLVGRLFAQGAALGGAEAWLAAYLYAFQIYFDFSAYSDMAVGLGWLLGLDLPQNFRTPYVSSGPGEFWRRWHFTLSAWIRDYVYFPLGGSRVGLPRQLLNLLVAMAFSGLWHGAAWTFVLWGLYHGLLCVLEKLVRVARERPRRPAARPWGRLAALTPRALRRGLGVALFFHLTVLGWVFFRAPDLATALAMARNMLGLGTVSFGLLAGPSRAIATLVAPLYLLHLAEHFARRDGSWLAFWRTRVPAPVRGLVYALAATLVLVFVSTEPSSFIYFRF